MCIRIELPGRWNRDGSTGLCSSALASRLDGCGHEAVGQNEQHVSSPNEHHTQTSSELAPMTVGDGSCYPYFVASAELTGLAEIHRIHDMGPGASRHIIHYRSGLTR